jgi:hypothetical protein
MRRKEGLLLLGVTVIAAIVLYLPVSGSRQQSRPAADAFATHEFDCIYQLRHLLLRRPQQSHFTVCWEVNSNEMRGWARLEYNRKNNVLVYRPFRYNPEGWIFTSRFPFVEHRKPFNTGHRDVYSCSTAKESLIRKAREGTSVGGILLEAGCDSGSLLAS